MILITDRNKLKWLNASSEKVLAGISVSFEDEIDIWKAEWKAN